MTWGLQLRIMAKQNVVERRLPVASKGWLEGGMAFPVGAGVEALM